MDRKPEELSRSFGLGSTHSDLVAPQQSADSPTSPETLTESATVKFRGSNVGAHPTASVESAGTTATERLVSKASPQTSPVSSILPELLMESAAVKSPIENVGKHCTADSENATVTESDPSDDTVALNAEGILERMITFRTKSISQIAAESKNIVGSSYRLLPEDYPQPISSHRGNLENEVLNNDSVCLSKESAKVIKRKNIYENKLNRLEDQRYELDMNIERTNSTIHVLEPIVKMVLEEESSATRINARIERSFNSVHYGTIRSLYGERTAEFLEGMKNNPERALPILLYQLNERNVMFRDERFEMNKSLRNNCEQDYLRSGDHRSRVFKKAGKIELQKKTLLDDLLDPDLSLSARDAEYSKERGYLLGTSGGEHGVVNDRSRALEAVVTAAKVGPPYVLYLSYDDNSLHRIACKLISVGIQEYVDYEGAEKKVMGCFRKLIMSFFGAPFHKKDKKMDSLHSSNIIFGDETLYLMFRLYDILYERLIYAKNLAREVIKDLQIRDELNEKGKKGIQSRMQIPKTEICPSRVNKLPFVQSSASDAASVFNEFLSQFKRFFNRTLKLNEYEDFCRALLGPRSFILFTLDVTLRKTAEFVLKSCGPEFVTRRFIDMYYEIKLKNCSSPGSSRSQKNYMFEKALYESVDNHLQNEDITANTLFRMEFAMRDLNKGMMAISLLVRTARAENEKLRMIIAKNLDAYLGISI